MFWAAQPTIEETFNAHTDVCFDSRRAPEPVIEDEKMPARRESTTETSRPQKKMSKAVSAQAVKPRKTHSFTVGKIDGSNK